MTLITLITTNAVLAALVVYAVVYLLHHGIRSDVHAVEQHLKSTLHRLPERDRERIAA